MHGVAPQMCWSGSPSIVRRRSRGSLPRLHLKLNYFSPRSHGLLCVAKRPRKLAVYVREGIGDQLVRLANGGRLIDGGRHRQHDLLFAGGTPRRIA